MPPGTSARAKRPKHATLYDYGAIDERGHDCQRASNDLSANTGGAGTDRSLAIGRGGTACRRGRFSHLTAIVRRLGMPLGTLPLLVTGVVLAGLAWIAHAPWTAAPASRGKHTGFCGDAGHCRRRRRSPAAIGPRCSAFGPRSLPKSFGPGEGCGRETPLACTRERAGTMYPWSG